jgi:hypothetical protein
MRPDRAADWFKWALCAVIGVPLAIFGITVVAVNLYLLGTELWKLAFW